MNGRVNRNGKYENRYYACIGYIQFHDCDCLTARQESLEKAVLDHLLPLLDEAELAGRIVKRNGRRLELLRDEVAALEDCPGTASTALRSMHRPTTTCWSVS